MKIDYKFTDAPNGGFGQLGRGIQRELLKAGHELVDENPDVYIRYGVPDIMQDVPDDHTIPLVYYTVWESSLYPLDWAQAIKNKKVNLVLTATEFTKNSLSKCGIDAKVWHHGVDPFWQYRKRPDDGIFTFIHWNAYEWRKGWEIVLKAFLEEFRIDEPVRLVMKARERGESVWIVENPEEGIKHPLIKEVIGHISNEELVDLIYTADCGVFPVKGEGWFMPSMEFAASGGAVILPKQMGLTEQWIEGGYIDVELEGWINAEPRYPGYMMLVSVDDLRKKMRWAFQNQDRVRMMGRIASKGVHTRFNWSKIIKDLEGYLNLLLN